MMMSFDFDYQHALRQAIVFSIFCEESLVRDIRIYSKERRGALLFLGVSDAALNRGRRSLKNHY